MEKSELTEKIGELSETAAAFNRLYEITEILRGDNGCPWDKEQTPKTLRTTFIEETFEVIDAIDEENPQHTKEELGDALFNIMLISYCYQQAGDFTFREICDDISEKLVRRHPHIFKDEKIDSAEKVEVSWDKIKENVEGRKSLSVLDTVPKSFPPLLKAYKFLKKASKKGFDWKSAADAEKKVLEELDEVREAACGESKDHLEEEMGDLLLACVNLSRKHGVDPNVALEKACTKFGARFRQVEKRIDEGETSLDKMMENWNKAKASS